jgi:hypothetical protein
VYEFTLDVDKLKTEVALDLLGLVAVNVAVGAIIPEWVEAFKDLVTFNNKVSVAFGVLLPVVNVAKKFDV